MFIPEHLEVFKSSVKKYFELPEAQRWAGGYAAISLVDYLEKKCLNFDDQNMLFSPSQLKFNRAQLIDRAKAESGISDLEVVLDIFAWGGINRKHACLALQSFNSWKSIISKLRNEEYSSIKGYEKFYELRNSNELSGIGPAYYTKLIFFCHPKHDGYIMDQWTARSVNLLLSHSDELIHLNKSKYFQGVSDRNKNHQSIYKKFCCNVKRLSEECGYPEHPSKIEEALFSKGGSNKLDWREYVIQNS